MLLNCLKIHADFQTKYLVNFLVIKDSFKIYLSSYLIKILENKDSIIKKITLLLMRL